MKKRKMIIVTFIMIFSITFCIIAAANPAIKSTGIGFRGTLWRPDKTSAQVKVYNHSEYAEVNVGGGGAWLNFFSRMNDDWYLEFGVGAIGHVETRSHYFDQEDVNVSAVTPLVLGLRHDLLPPGSQTALQPYFSFGAGPYWLNDIQVRERDFGVEEEVSVKSKLKAGGYAGGGVNFMFTGWFGINFDVKYHFVNFNVRGENSGFEYGMGILFMWGRYQPEKTKENLKITIE